MALSQVMWYCAKTNWICLHVPSGQLGTHKNCLHTEVITSNV